jgi:hypothetical protein
VNHAFLAIVLITDEDDCSAETTTDLFIDDAGFPNTTASFRCSQVGHLCDAKSPPVGVFDAPLENCTPNPNGRLIKVNDIVDSIRALKMRPDQQILVSGIFGWPNNPTGARYRYLQTNQGIDVAPICTSANGEAAVGLRLKQFVESFGTGGSYFSICDGDFSPALKQIGDKLAEKLSNTCITAKLADTRPEQGVQADCQVIDRVPAGTGYKDDPIPPCSSNTRSQGGACWKLTVDPSCADSHYKMDVDRGNTMAPQGTQQAIKCLTCANTKNPDSRCGYTLP